MPYLYLSAVADGFIFSEAIRPDSWAQSAKAQFCWCSALFRQKCGKLD